MQKKSVKIWYTHDWIDSVEHLAQVLGLSNNIEFIYDEENPEYIFAGEQIYSSRAYLDKFLKLAKDDTVLIFFCLEAISPDFNIFDYSITTDLRLGYNDRAVRRRYVPVGENFQDFNTLHLQPAEELLRSKTEFCNFIYSNGQAHPYRDRMFHELSRYKQVHSLGRHLRNYDSPEASDPQYMRGSIAMKRPYKFSIAFENATFPGYTTEKILTSFQAQTIPIYWGNPFVAREYNTQSFINCHDYKNFDDVIDVIKSIDHDDALWCKIMSQPKQSPEQIADSQASQDEVTQFLDNIFLPERKLVKRAPVGTWPQWYKNWFKHVPVYEEGLYHFLRKIKWKIINRLRKK